jgi:transposase
MVLLRVPQSYIRKEPVVKNSTRFVGLDVHQDLIAAAVCEADGTATSLGTLPNSPDAIARLMRKLGPADKLRVCYEAGPCGFVLYWQLCELGIDCMVVAPSLIPVRPGDRVKTDRRDALKMARCHRNGDLVPVFVPDAAHLALRELVRSREAARGDQKRARNRLRLMLLRYGIKPQEAIKRWTAPYMAWVQTVRLQTAAEQYSYDDAVAQVLHQTERVAAIEPELEQAVQQAPPALREVIRALQSLVGVKVLTAATVAVEAGDLCRFDKAPQLMSYAGLVPSEHSSGGLKGQRRGGISKAGNAHLRRVVVEAAWSYSKPCRSDGPVAKRRVGQDPVVVQLAHKAQKRLRKRYVALTARGLPSAKAATVVARELLGFMWGIAKRVQQSQSESAAG